MCQWQIHSWQPLVLHVFIMCGSAGLYLPQVNCLHKVLQRTKELHMFPEPVCSAWLCVSGGYIHGQDGPPCLCSLQLCWLGASPSRLSPQIAAAHKTVVKVRAGFQCHTVLHTQPRSWQHGPPRLCSLRLCWLGASPSRLSPQSAAAHKRVVHNFRAWLRVNGNHMHGNMACCDFVVCGSTGLEVRQVNCLHKVLQHTREL